MQNLLEHDLIAQTSLSSTPATPDPTLTNVNSQDGPKSESSECPICQETMSCAQFDSSNREDTEVSESVQRLKCGHAYHNVCLLKHLRSASISCPVCRDGPEETRATRARRFEEADAQEPLLDEVPFAIQPNGTLHIDAEWFSRQIQGSRNSSSNTQANFGIDLWNAMDTLSTLRGQNTRVQRQRCLLNREIRNYAKVESRLMQKRKEAVNKALEAFTQEELPGYDRVVRQLRRVLQKTRDVEQDELQKSLGIPQTQVLFDILNVHESEQHVRAVQRRHQSPVLDPSRRSFWVRRHGKRKNPSRIAPQSPSSESEMSVEDDA